MPGKEDQPIGDLWRYARSRQAAEVEAKERQRLDFARLEQQVRDNHLARQMDRRMAEERRKYREEKERPFLLLSAPPWARELLLGRFRVRELLEEVGHIWQGAVEPITGDVMNPDRWGYGLVASTYKPPAEEYSTGLIYSAGAGDGAHGSWEMGTVRNEGTTFTKKIRVVVSRSLLREDFYDGRWYKPSDYDRYFVMGDKFTRLDPSVTIPATSSRELLVQTVGEELARIKARGPYSYSGYRVVIR